MDKVQDLMARLGELHGLVDGLRAEVEGYGKRASELAPKVAEVERLDGEIAEKNAALLKLVEAISSAQTDYRKMEEHFNQRPF